VVDYLYSPLTSGFRYEAFSNPYRADESSGRGWTRTKYDALGRVVEVAQFEGDTWPAPWGTNSTGAVTQTSYAADETTVTDPAGKRRKTVVDPLGRIVKVVEDP
jgi:hypothetical protein